MLIISGRDDVVYNAIIMAVYLIHLVISFNIIHVL